MFDATSRYAGLPTATLATTDGDGQERTIRFVRRRFVPSGEGATTLVEHTVTQNERLDNITARYLGDPLQFWRVCDANNVLRPEELTEEPGRIIRIVLPQV